MSPEGAAPRRVMAVGPPGAGKTTLLAALGLVEGRVRKTEMVTFSPLSIDTPGELLDNPRLYHAILMNATKARVVLFLEDGTRDSRYPPGLARSIRAPVLGVVTKSDEATAEGVRRAREVLLRAGAREVRRCSSVTGEGLREMKERIEELLEEGCSR